jgi:electron transfer flavoprotein alpha subunit
MIMRIFVITETTKATAELCSGARDTGAEVSLVSIGGTNIVEKAADRVYLISPPEGSLYEDAFGTVLALISREHPDAVYFEPTRRLKVISGRLAASLKTSAIIDVMDFAADGYTTTMYFGGVAMRKQRPVQGTAIYTVGSGTFEVTEGNGINETVTLDFIAPTQGVKLLATEQLPPQDVDLTAAKRVVCVGRGIAHEEDLTMIRQLCVAMGAELGCTRPITENEGWLPRELYVGISGVTLKPDVYMGIGLSGQMQHTVGVNRSKVFVAINKDKNAPIFQQADYGLIADLYAVVPEITTALAQV